MRSGSGLQSLCLVPPPHDSGTAAPAPPPSRRPAPLAAPHGTRSRRRPQNLLLVIAGNIVGGGFIVGGAEYFIYDWTRVIRATQQQQAALLRSHGSMDDLEAAPEHQHAAGVWRPVQRHAHTAAGGGTVDAGRVQAQFANYDGDGDGLLNEQAGAL